ncbi:MAG: cyclic nucleotide-binding domain-containing protein [Treponema sp.]|jgi:CRP-like cAMP-binding protein|nr:cyclic nucleotide-binding domain-containing protein [Treponema sp.]
MIEAALLQKYALFGGLMKDQIQQILPVMETETYKPGEDIIVEGAPNDKIRFILEGRAAAIKHNVTLSEFATGDVFGEMEVLDVMPSAATIKALSGTEVISISNKGLRDIYKVDVHIFSIIIMNLARELSRRLRRMDEKAVSAYPEEEDRRQ